MKQGKDAYRKMPCMVDADGRETGAEADEMRTVDEAILLIATNSQREKTDWDKVQETTRLRGLLERKRRFEKIPGETRKLIAEQLGTTPAQVGRYDSIAKRLIPALKGWLAEGKIGISVAYELSTLPEDAQWEAAGECLGKRATVTLEDVRRWKLIPPPLPEREESAATAPVREQVADSAEGGRNDEPDAYIRQEEPKQAEEPSHVEPERERMTGKQAAYILKDLQMFCEEMVSIESERAETWEERAAALDATISVLWKAR